MTDSHEEFFVKNKVEILHELRSSEMPTNAINCGECGKEKDPCSWCSATLSEYIDACLANFRCGFCHYARFVCPDAPHLKGILNTGVADPTERFDIRSELMKVRDRRLCPTVFGMPVQRAGSYESMRRSLLDAAVTGSSMVMVCASEDQCKALVESLPIEPDSKRIQFTWPGKKLERKAQ